MKKRVYSKELKERTVRLSYQRENVKALTDELGISPQRIILKFYVRYINQGCISKV